MNFGVAGFLPGHEKRIAMAKSIGYGFVESCLFSLNDDFSKEQIEKMAEALEDVGMPCVAVNGMFPKRISILGSSADKSEISEYLHSAFEKTACLDYEICVLGSGRSRRVPDGYHKDKAFDEFAYLLSDTIMPIAEKYGKKIAIEPLSYYITNVVNTFGEAVRLVSAVGHPSLCALMDFFI